MEDGRLPRLRTCTRATRSTPRIAAARHDCHRLCLTGISQVVLRQRIAQTMMSRSPVSAQARPTSMVRRCTRADSQVRLNIHIRGGDGSSFSAVGYLLQPTCELARIKRLLVPPGDLSEEGCVHLSSALLTTLVLLLTSWCSALVVCIRFAHFCSAWIAGFLVFSSERSSPMLLRSVSTANAVVTMRSS